MPIMLEFLQSVPAGIWSVLLLLALFAVWSLNSFRQFKKRSEQMVQFQESIQPGDQVILSSGIHGKLVKLDRETALIRIARDVEITVDRYAISKKVIPSEE